MNYRNIETGQVVSEAQISAALPNTIFSWPFRPPEGYQEVAPTADEQAQAFRAQVVLNVQARLDAFAQARGYDDVHAAAIYAGSSVERFQLEGQCCLDAMSNTWATLYQVLGEVEAGQRAMPANYAAVEALLPALSWPN